MTPVGCEIIVVDDDVSMSLAIERLLTAAGWAVRAYDTAEELLEAGDFSGAAVLVLDIQLPGISGLDLFRKLRAAGPVPPVIFITAQDRRDLQQLVDESGAVAFFTKPFDGTELIREIRRQLPAA